MFVQPFWISDTLAIVPRPRGGDWLDDEMVAMRQAGIAAVVSMLEEPESTELGLLSEQAAAKSAGIDFVGFPIPDRGVPPDLRKYQDFLKDLEARLRAGRPVGIHCRACIGRSSIVAASLLIRSGMTPVAAWSQIESARGLHVPDTQEQRTWVDQTMRANL